MSRHIKRTNLSPTHYILSLQQKEEKDMIPLIIGGGIRIPEKAISVIEAGADIVVVGNRLEEDPNLIYGFTEAIASINS